MAATLESGVKTEAREPAGSRHQTCLCLSLVAVMARLYTLALTVARIDLLIGLTYPSFPSNRRTRSMRHSMYGGQGRPCAEWSPPRLILETTK